MGRNFTQYFMLFLTTLAFSFASDHFDIVLSHSGGGISSGFNSVPGPMVWTTYPLVVQNHFTCDTCSKGHSENQTSIYGTDGDNTPILANNIPGFEDSVLAPYWGSGKPFSMSWDDNGRSVQFFVSGSPMIPFCDTVYLSTTPIILSDVENPGVADYAPCSQIGELGISWNYIL